MNFKGADVAAIVDRYKDVFCPDCLAKMDELAKPAAARIERGLPPWPWQVAALTRFHKNGLCKKCLEAAKRRAGGR